MERINTAMNIDGLTSMAGLALMDVFVGKAIEFAGHLNLIEYGAYKGRSAALLAGHVGTGWLHIVDPDNKLEIDKIKAISSRVTWHKSKSEAFQIPEDDFIASHHDASHFFENILNELLQTAPKVHERGVMILDDFNDGYSQVRAAYYYARFVEKLPFEVLLIAANKCILVHENSFVDYEEFVLDSLLARLRDYGISAGLQRTDNHKLSRAFLLRPKRKEEPAWYGLDSFGDRFYKKTKSSRTT